MKTNEEIIQFFYDLVKQSGLLEVVSGTLRKIQKPKEKGEDVVISMLANYNGQTQRAIVNCNVYVPDVETQGELRPDTKRLKTLEKAFGELFSRGYGFDGQMKFYLETQDTLTLENVHEHMINNRISITIINE